MGWETQAEHFTYEIARLRNRIEDLEAFRTKSESCASDCSADGRRIKQGEASVQPAGPEQTLTKLKTYIKERHKHWETLPPKTCSQINLAVLDEITSDYKEMLDIIEGEAGGGQDDRSRPAG